MYEGKNLPNQIDTVKHALKDKNLTGETMIIPIRCWSCGKPIAHLWEEFKEKRDNGGDVKETLDKLGIERYCCRALFLGQVDLIEEVSKFKKS